MKGRKTGGRKAGVPNKVTGAVKDMTLQALELEGGVEYLRYQARRNPVAFMTLLGKVLPMQVSHSGAVDLNFSATYASLKRPDASV
jgi:hypothetical protein